MHASSPQFILYALASPENAVIWHGIGAFGASQLVSSYATTRFACSEKVLFQDLTDHYNLRLNPTLQINLIPEKMWTNPNYNNIDASVGCIKNWEDLVKKGMRLEVLSNANYIRTPFKHV